VDNESDDYAPDDIPLTRVVEDPALDAAILKAKAALRVMPYRIGRSSQLRVGDAVTVQGFPLGVFRAVTHGQVINPVDHDHQGDWEHDDFIVDAALSSGNSGSPVLAVSKRTGEYELVGLFHAAYESGHGLEAVIGIDQLRDLMVTLKRPGHSGDVDHRSGPEQRAEFVAAVSRADFVPYFKLGGLTVGVRQVGDLLVYEVFSGTFPTDSQREALLVEAPAPAMFGQLQAVWSEDSGQYSVHTPDQLDADSRARLGDFMRRLHEVASSTVRLRALRLQARASRQAQQDLDQELRASSRRAVGDADLVQSFLDANAHMGGADVPAKAYEAIYAGLTVPAVPPVRPELVSLHPEQAHGSDATPR
jgi:hypothetical protein